MTFFYFTTNTLNIQLFFVNACRGAEYQQTVKVSKSAPVIWPSDADLFIHYSTMANEYSMRNTQMGSWFIQALVNFSQNIDYLSI